MSEQKKMPSRELSFTVDKNNYKVQYPNTGQFLQIETMKVNLKGGVAMDPTVNGQIANYSADMIAFFHTCCPEMKKDLGVKTFSDLDMLANKKLLNVYIKTIIPWLNEWEILLNTEEEEETKTEEIA